MTKRAIILLAGELQSWPEDFTPNSDDLIICADGGFDHALRLGVRPHLLLGDMDSINPGHLAIAREQGIEITTFPAEKDMTDSDLAIETAHQRGYREIVILGALGDRLDHSLANLLMMARWSERGLKLTLRDERNSAQVISDETLIVRGAPGDYVSLIPLSAEVMGVTTSELKYPLNDATLCFGSTWGISNELHGPRAVVRCASGLLMVTVYHRRPSF